MTQITLDKLPLGQEGIIHKVGGEGILRRRLLDMGLTPRTRVMDVNVHLSAIRWKFFYVVMN